MKNSEKRGLFIVFEGGDGSGKTTQANRLAKKIEAETGRRCLCEREPDARNIAGAMVRAALYGGAVLSPESTAYMHVADRIEHVDFMLPLILAGTNIVCDRFYPSTLAYNRSKRLSMERLYELNRPCFETLDADLIIYLDVTPEESARRRAAERASEEIYDSDEKQNAIRQNFFEVLDFLKEKGRRVAVIDSSASPDEVADEIWKTVRPLLEQ